jgi:translation initiation factor 1
MSKRGQDSKIDTSGGGGAPLLNPFASLILEGLPEGPKEVIPDRVEEKVNSKKGRVVLRRETAERGGKVVVVVSGFEVQIGDEEISELARQLRKSCGCGGTVKGREIEIQGDQPGKICQFLEERGFRVVGVRG